jgi:hypothetical protein
MYSQGKKLLEQERELKKLSVSALEKAKSTLQVYVNELTRTKSLADDPEWINAVTETVQKALSDYEVGKQELLLQIKDVEQKVELRGSLETVLQKANSLDDTFVEIRVLLSQIFKAVTADAELKRRTLENINAELNR